MKSGIGYVVVVIILPLFFIFVLYKMYPFQSSEVYPDIVFRATSYYPIQSIAFYDRDNIVAVGHSRFPEIRFFDSTTGKKTYNLHIGGVPQLLFFTEFGDIYSIKYTRQVNGYSVEKWNFKNGLRINSKDISLRHADLAMFRVSSQGNGMYLTTKKKHYDLKNSFLIIGREKNNFTNPFINMDERVMHDTEALLLSIFDIDIDSGSEYLIGTSPNGIYEFGLNNLYEYKTIYSGKNIIFLSLARNDKLVAASSNGNVYTFIKVNNSWEKRDTNTISDGVYSIQVSPDGEHIAYTQRDNDNKKLFIVKLGCNLPPTELKIKGKEPVCFAFGTQGKKIAAGMNDGTVAVWNVFHHSDIPDTKIPDRTQTSRKNDLITKQYSREEN